MTSGSASSSTSTAPSCRPCGFSAQYNCPLPPASNRFPVPIRAGEKNVVFRDGFDIYAA